MFWQKMTSTISIFFFSFPLPFFLFCFLEYSPVFFYICLYFEIQSFGVGKIFYIYILSGFLELYSNQVTFLMVVRVKTVV